MFGMDKIFVVFLCYLTSRVGAADWIPFHDARGKEYSIKVLHDETVIKKPQADSKEYRHILLQNRMDVLLVRDEEASTSQASLEVAVGSLQDPPEYSELTHLLEHVLIHHFVEFVDSRGGSANGGTGPSSTNFEFEIQLDDDAFLDALRMFSEVFSSFEPNQNLVDEEIRVVNEENRVLSARVRSDLLMYQLYGKKVGGLLEGKLLQGVDVALLSTFFESHYSSHIMKLKIIISHDLDTLQEMVIRLFSGIREITLPSTVAAANFRKPDLSIEERRVLYLETPGSPMTFDFFFVFPNDIKVPFCSLLRIVQPVAKILGGIATLQPFLAGKRLIKLTVFPPDGKYNYTLLERVWELLVLRIRFVQAHCDLFQAITNIQKQHLLDDFPSSEVLSSSDIISITDTEFGWPYLASGHAIPVNYDENEFVKVIKSMTIDNIFVRISGDFEINVKKVSLGSGMAYTFRSNPNVAKLWSKVRDMSRDDLFIEHSVEAKEFISCDKEILKGIINKHSVYPRVLTSSYTSKTLVSSPKVTLQLLTENSGNSVVYLGIRFLSNAVSSPDATAADTFLRAKTYKLSEVYKFDRHKGLIVKINGTFESVNSWFDKLATPLTKKQLDEQLDFDEQLKAPMLELQEAMLQSKRGFKFPAFDSLEMVLAGNVNENDAVRWKERLESLFINPNSLGYLHLPKERTVADLVEQVALPLLIPKQAASLEGSSVVYGFIQMGNNPMSLIEEAVLALLIPKVKALLYGYTRDKGIYLHSCQRISVLSITGILLRVEAKGVPKNALKETIADFYKNLPGYIENLKRNDIPLQLANDVSLPSQRLEDLFNGYWYVMTHDVKINDVPVRLLQQIRRSVKISFHDFKSKATNMIGQLKFL